MYTQEWQASAHKTEGIAELEILIDAKTCGWSKTLKSSQRITSHITY